MRKLIRITAGAALLGAVLFVGTTPVSADHDSPAGTNWPCTSGDGLNPPTGCDGDAYHEEMPDLAEAQPADVCVVGGQVLPGTVTNGGPQHLPGVGIPLVNEDPAHSHFEFVQSVISCLGTGELDVAANGGNDGHMIDVLDYPQSLPDATPLEVDPITSDAAQHEFDDHHGSTNESGWSNSSLYSGGQGGGSSNACTSAMNNNKADISITNTGGASESGWVKYIRVGVALYAWGCFELDGDISGRNPFFSAVMVILPDLVPVSNPPFLPGGDPTCLIPNSPVPCGFIIIGAALRGPGWLIDTEPLN